MNHHRATKCNKNPLFVWPSDDIKVVVFSLSSNVLLFQYEVNDTSFHFEKFIGITIPISYSMEIRLTGIVSFSISPTNQAAIVIKFKEIFNVP